MLIFNISPDMVLKRQIKRNSIVSFKMVSSSEQVIDFELIAFLLIPDVFERAVHFDNGF